VNTPRRPGSGTSTLLPAADDAERTAQIARHCAMSLRRASACANGRTVPAARLLVALAVGLFGGCSDGPAASSTSSSSEPVTPAGPPFAVGRHDLVLVDTARAAAAVPAAGVPAAPERTIDLIVIYPAAGEPGDVPTIPDAWSEVGDPDGRSAVVDAEPADGPFPLLVFAHGWSGRGGSFLAQAESWARAGYVVALPTFPLSRAGIAFSDDYVNQPGDIGFVIDELLAARADDLLADLVDAAHVAVGGHSLGSATVFRMGYNSCCTDDRIDAVIAVSGGPIDYAEPGYGNQPQTPMLLAHGVADPGVPVAISDAMVTFITAPVTYLRLDQADHTSVFVGANGELFNAVVLAFLDAHLKGEPAALDDLARMVEDSGLAELREG